MSRKHVDLGDVAEIDVAEGPFAGAAKRVLSHDDETGAETVVLRCPPGWTGDLTSLDGYSSS
jgi:hypothetical protein